MLEAENRICPFCGGEVDPEGWFGDGCVRGPECNGCGATARSIEDWNNRVDVTRPQMPTSSGMLSEQAFEHYVANPNLFRTLAKRLNEYAIFAKVAGYPMEEGEIGPDCTRASLLFEALADVVEESKE